MDKTLKNKAFYEYKSEKLMKIATYFIRVALIECSDYWAIEGVILRNSCKTVQLMGEMKRLQK